MIVVSLDGGLYTAKFQSEDISTDCSLYPDSCENWISLKKKHLNFNKLTTSYADIVINYYFMSTDLKYNILAMWPIS